MIGGDFIFILDRIKELFDFNNSNTKKFTTQKKNIKTKFYRLYIINEDDRQTVLGDFPTFEDKERSLIFIRALRKWGIKTHIFPLDVSEEQYYHLKDKGFFEEPLIDNNYIYKLSLRTTTKFSLTTRIVRFILPIIGYLLVLLLAVILHSILTRNGIPKLF